MNGFSRITLIYFKRKWKNLLYSIFCLLIPFFCFSTTPDRGRLVFNSEIVAIEIRAENLAEDSAQVDLLIRLFAETVNNDIALAEKYANEAFTLSEKLNYSKGLIDSHRSLGDIHRIKGNFVQAEKSIQQGVALSELASDDASLAKCYLAMYTLFFVKGDYPKAAEFNKKSLAIGEKLSNQEILAHAYGNQGILNGIEGKHIPAVEYFLKSMEMFKSLKDENQVGLSLMRIGHTFELAGSYDQAMDYLLQALEIQERINDQSHAGWSLLNIGVVYSRMNNDSLAMVYYKKALVLAERGEDLRLILTCLDNIGGKYSIQRDFKRANAFLMKAYKLSQNAGHNSRTVYITGNLAENFLYAGRYDSAEIFGTENLRLAIREKNTFEKKQAYLVLSQIYSATHQNEKAYKMLLRHVELNDSIFNAEKSQQIEELREKYETESKEQEIVMLTQEKAAAEFRRNSFALLSILLLIVGMLVFAILRLRIKRNQLLLQKEKELDRMKSRFFANISHEFRTPLTLILGPIDDMISQAGNSGIQKYLSPMKKSATRLLELVNQLLDLSKIESGKLKPELTKNNMVSIVRGIGMSFDSLAETKRIQLEIIAGGQLPEIYMDRDKIETILSNLLSNAFKFTPEMGRISVTVHQVSDCFIPGVMECLEIIVKDSGRGIPQAEMAHIFDRFYQADNNQLHQQDGSGIGLALTKELVELHHGVIRAFSDPDGGTEIRLQIPLNLEEIMKDFVSDRGKPVIKVKYNHSNSNGENSNGEGVALDGAEIESNANKPIVLLIEDHVDVRHYIRETIGSLYDLIEAGDGEEGVAMALEQIPDLILCDVMMPRMNGNQVCKTLKREEKTSHIPIILLTAKADIESKIEGLETKADDYITKPFVPKELLLRIQNLIESRQNLRKKYLRATKLKPSEIVVNSVDEQFLKRMMHVLEARMADEKFSVEDLGDEMGMSRSQLHRKLKALIDQGPNQFIRTFRLNRAHDLLKMNAATSAEIAYSVGFSSPSYFTKCFHEQFGYTPSEIPE